MPESISQTLIPTAPKSLRLNGLHPELLKCLKNDASVISLYLDKYPTAWGGLKLEKCGLKSRLRHLYSAIIQPHYYQARHLLPGFNMHWNIDSSKMRDKIRETENEKDDDKMRYVSAMERKTTPIDSLNGECIQLNFSQYFKATYEDHRKIVEDLVNVYSISHRKVLITYGKNISYIFKSISELERDLPKYSRKKILHALISQNDIFSNNSHQSLSKEKWFIHCKLEKIHEQILLIPKTRHSYVSELEKKKMGSEKKYKSDQRRRQRNYLAFNKSWNDHVEFYKYFNEYRGISDETYNDYIVYLMNLIWEYFSEEAIKLHDTRPPVKRRHYIGVGGNGGAWHYLVIARAITKLNPKQRALFFRIKSTDEKFDKKFNNGKSEERWNKFMSNFANRSLEIGVSRDLICSKEGCDSIKMYVERELFHCEICDTVNDYNFETKKFENPERHEKQKYINQQHKYTYLQQFGRNVKIGKWKEYLTQCQKDFLNQDTLILLGAEYEVNSYVNTKF